LHLKLPETGIIICILSENSPTSKSSGKNACCIEQRGEYEDDSQQNRKYQFFNIITNYLISAAEFIMKRNQLERKRS